MNWRPLLVGAVIFALGFQDTVFAHSLEYLYIESNSGTSSGGHVGVKLDDTVFHYQNKEGWILLEREDWNHFQHLYAELDNRDIHLATLKIPDDQILIINDHLARLYQTQNALLGELSSLDQDISLIRKIQRKESFILSGAGFFLESSQHADHKEPDPEAFNLISPSLAGRLLFAIKEQQKRLRYQSSPHQEKFGSPQSFSPGYAERWSDLKRNEIALEAVLSRRFFDTSLMIDAGPLREASEDPASCSTASHLARYERRLEENTVKLIQQPSPGSGLTLLRNLARIAAIRASLKQHKLLLLRPSLKGNTEQLWPDAYMETPQQRLRADFEENIRRLQSDLSCSEELDDVAYHRLELAALDLWTTEDAIRSGVPPAFDEDPGLPDAPLEIDLASEKNLETIAASDLERALQLHDQLTELFGEKARYSLIERNCVTELIRAVNSSFEGATEPDNFRGHISPLGSQAFIPFRFFELVKSRYPITQIRTIPSFRHRKLANVETLDTSFWARIRESNTLTGTLYEPRDSDGLFLFFTDETVWSRPLLGTINVGLATGGMAVGLIASPVDQGRLLFTSARGALFSLPELALWNIRKGSYTEATLRK